MNKKKLLAGILAATLTLSSLAGCGKKEVVEETEAKPQVKTEEVVTNYDITFNDTPLIMNTQDIVIGKDGMVINELTGEWIDESLANQRPVAVMINNLKPAMPQAGVEQADIIFEILVEGGITRLMAVYSDFSGLDKIGPVRSARHYFDRKAIEFNAVYVHVGHSIYAEADFAELAGVLDHMDGVDGVGRVMTYRTSDRKAPHNCYTSTEGILKGLDYSGIDLTKKSDYSKMFMFNNTDMDIDGAPADKIVTAYNKGRKPWFEYDETTGKYLRFQYDAPQIDQVTGNQLAFENIIIQFIPHSELVAGLQDMNWNSSGEGYYATNGKIIPITWSKTGTSTVTRYYNIDGTQLKMNPGKTWITVFPSSNKGGVIVE